MSPAQASAQPFCSVIIVNYNGRHLLEGCLSSVLAQAYPAFEVILVDNGSVDGSTLFVREKFPTIRLVEAGENLGFAGGNNLGVEQSTAESIVLVNNDTVVAPGWLSGLLEALSPPDVACASSLVRTEGIPDRYYEKNGSVNLLFLNIMRIFEKPENIFYCGGASLAFKRSAIGVPFDPDYFAYAEDLYLGLRARFMGMRVVHTNTSVVRHLGGATAKRSASAFVTYLQERNRVLTLLLFFSGKTLLKALPFLLLNATARMCAGVVSRRHSLSGVVRAYIWLATHPRTILLKRRSLRAERTVPDDDVLGWMTGKLVNDGGRMAATINGVALLYCRIVGLHTIERFPPGVR